MRALWLEEGSLTVREDLPAPSPPAGEALVRVRLVGVCATDLELRRGYCPFTGVPGHELVGEVESAPTSPAWEGRRVVGEINASCRVCPTCRAGRPTHCPSRTVLGIAGRQGAMAERVLLPVHCLHEVPERLPDDVAVFVEPLAAALEVLEQVRLRPTDSVVVVGAGRLGQLVARVLAAVGCDLAVVARHDRQRELLAEVGIASIAVEEVPGHSVDLVVEATGDRSGFELARRLVRPRGAIVLKSTYAGRLELDASSLVVDEVTVVGSRCGPFAPALGLLERGLVDPSPLVEATYALADGVEAFDRAARPGALKVLVDPTR